MTTHDDQSAEIRRIEPIVLTKESAEKLQRYFGREPDPIFGEVARLEEERDQLLVRIAHLEAERAEIRLPVVSTGRCTTSHHACDCVLERLRRLEAERARLQDALHCDRTGLAEALAGIVKLCEGYDWATEGRGPYAYDDDEYRREFGRALDQIAGAATEALGRSGDLAHGADGCRDFAAEIVARLRADQPAEGKSDRSAHIRAEARRLERQSQEWLADEVTKNIGAAEEEQR